MNISTFFGLNVGTSGLNSMQQAEDVVSNNIANANTTGYVRETVSIGESEAYPQLPANDAPLIAGQLGQGADVSSVVRQTNEYLNEQDRANQGSYQMYNVHNQNLTQIESILNEPSANSLQNSLDQFFSSWQTLSTDPSNTAARQTVVSEAQTMGQTFQTVTNELEKMNTNLSNTVIGQVTQLNQYATQVAQLNQQITSIEQNGENPNQLLDQRGQVLDEMAKLANITYSQNSTNSAEVDVKIVGSSGSTLTLVSGSTASSLPPAGVPGSPTLTNGTPLATLSPDSDPWLSYITSGSIAGNVKSVDDTSNLLGNLNSFIYQFANQVDNQQNAGKDQSGAAGSDLFSRSTSGSTSAPPTDSAGNYLLEVPSSFTTDKIAAGTTSSSGDSANALNMVALQNATTTTFSYSYDSVSQGSTVSSSYTGSFDQSLAAMVSGIGAETSQAASEESTANAIATQSSGLRQSVSGVSIDEESANMIQYQNAYDAAAKFITIYNAMLQTLIGIVS